MKFASTAFENERGGALSTNPLRTRWFAPALILFATAGSLVIEPLVLEAQTPPAPKGKAARAKAKADAEADAKNANAPKAKALPNAADPLDKAAKDAPKGAVASTDKFHYRLKVETPDGAALALSYYPAKIDTSTPVILMVHEKGRSSKDFETPIPDLKGVGAAEHFQNLGYAVVTFDLRGHGLNKRGTITKQDWLDMVYDLQTVYDFLLDRHNRGEFNVAKLGVVALGEGANLTAAWAGLSYGAVSGEGRTTDLAALALISPAVDWEGVLFETQMKDLGSRIPILLASGERDEASKQAVEKVREGLGKSRLNLVKYFPTLLHGYKLLQLEPAAVAPVDAFFDVNLKTKAIDWEGRFNMTPAPYSDIQVVKHPKAVAPAAAKPKAADAPKDAN